MAQEITLTVKAVIKKDTLVDSFDPGVVRIDLADVLQAGGVLEVSTTEAVVSFGSVSTPGLLFLQNQDATNHVKWGPESAGAMVPCGQLDPGEPNVLRVFPTTVLRWQAVGGNCGVLMKLLSN